jgi:glycosyltransferase involved in cell wall biosynthesis
MSLYAQIKRFFPRAGALAPAPGNAKLMPGGCGDKAAAIHARAALSETGQTTLEPRNWAGPETRRSPKRVCMITHSFYESDNRVLRYAEALVQRGDTVDVFAIRRTLDMPKEETISGVRLFRIQDRLGKRERTKSSFLWRILRFMVVGSWKIMRAHHQRRYDLVHVHNMPDFIVFAAWYPKLRGAAVILDIHDMVPEFFTAKFGSSRGSTLAWGLKLVEKISAAFANHVIIANDLWLEKYVSRSAPREKCSVFINHVDSRIFKTRPIRKAVGKPVILFPGSLEHHQGVDIAIRGFQKLRLRIPDAEFHIYGDGFVKQELIKLVQELELDEAVQFFDPLPIRQIASIMSKADLGVVAKRADGFGNEACSTKIMEFMSVGVPVVISETKVDRYYFDDSVVRFFESGNSDALSEAMYEVLKDSNLRCRMIERALDYVSRHSWENRRSDYLRLVDGLAMRN